MNNCEILTDEWKFQPDPLGEGELLGYHKSDFDDSCWREVSVPCLFDDIGEEFKSYEGRGWFRRHLDIKEEEMRLRLVLHFEACNYHTQVYVNGKKVFENPDGFLPFDVDIGNFVVPGLNLIAVCVDNTRKINDVPGNKRGWRPFGGIIRKVCFVVRPLIGIENISFLGMADGTYKMSVEWYNLRGSTVTGVVSLNIKDKTGCIVAAQEKKSVFSSTCGTEEFLGTCSTIRKWHPDSPYLYTLEVCLHPENESEKDIREIRVGFRTVGTEGYVLKLNGESITLKGFNRHEDSVLFGMKANPEEARNDIIKMKSLGANFVRLAHYPHDPATLDFCDEIGMLVMDEIPLYWMGREDESDGDITTKISIAKRQLKKMIRRDYNHPSVIFWSVSNETEEARPIVREGNKTLLKYAKEIDPSRLVVHVSHLWSDKELFHEYDDVICINRYPSINGRFSAKGGGYCPSSAASWWQMHLVDLHKKYPHKPIFVTECGYVGWKGINNGAVSEDQQAEFIDAELRAIDMPFVCGRSIWCFADHPWPEEPFLNYITLSPYGIYTRDRKPKKSVEVVRKIFGGEINRISSHSFDNYPVCMFRPHMNDIPEYNFPEGFSVRPMMLEEGALWEDVWRDAEPFIQIKPGLFLQEFGDDRLAIPQRCFFIVDSRGCAVGTISAWYNNNYNGKRTGRIHWLAIRPAYQGKGLARAALSYALKKMALWHSSVMLATSTGRIGAIKLYLDFGFLPDISGYEAKEAWKLLKSRLSHPVLDRCITN